MNMVGDDKPSLEELAHFGVKGMRWGQRKLKVTSNDIRSARKRHNERVSELHGLAMKGLATDSKAQRAKLVKQIHTLANEGLKSGDVSLASRATTGEKVTVALLSGGTGALLVRSKMQRQSEIAQDVLTKYSQLKVSDFD